MYKYIIYRLYSWRKKKNDDTPIATVICLLTGVHCFQLLIVYCIAVSLFQFPSFLGRINKGYLILFVFIFAGLHYFLLYNKQRWESYLEEFKNESPAKKKKGQFFVVGYMLGSILLFFIFLPILFEK